MKFIYLILLCSVIPAKRQQPASGQPLAAISLPVQILQIPVPVIIDGQATLVYEAHINNQTEYRMQILGFDVIAMKKEETILHYDSTALQGRMRSLAPSNYKDSANIIQPGATHILYIEARSGDIQFPTIYHCLRSRIIGKEGASAITYHDTLQFQKPVPVILSTPLDGNNWVAIYDPAWERGHRRVVYTVNGKKRIPGRFAIDFMKIDSLHYVKGNEDSISNWYGYAEDVLAVADGEIASVSNHFPESPTLSAHPDYKPEQATGNYISLKIAGNRYVFYEHLKPGSILVKPGQRVKKGQVIAQLGFTGQTTGPHLHFHLADQDSPLGAEGLPFVFEKFTQTGNYPDFSIFGKEKFTLIPARKVKKEMPASNSVIVFE